MSAIRDIGLSNDMTGSQRFIRDLQSRFGGLLDAKTNIQCSIRKLRKRPFEPEFEILKTLYPKGRCAIDVGANRGQSIEAIRLYHASVQINAFEPSAPLFRKLVTRHGVDNNLALHNIGLGNRTMSAELYVPYYRDFMYDGLSSFSEGRASNWLNPDTVWRFKPELLRVEKHPCHISALDKFSFKPFFLKIHVQGFELDVLQGAKHTIRSHFPVLLMANNEDADLWLRAKGWTQYAYFEDKLLEMKVNDLNLYNCVYLHSQNPDHRGIVEALN
ncbi:FkbM family methyltransferase [Robiginitomaculum antarcticum]|uniref:FkbM family methyltransferase n=1 Tax=Robiginitomaculum antarcticum TaxID=437507 RepID=UPI00036EF292|nr:FkbM family methyltransferase [Robiginitomaculum antarcticum]